MHTRSFMKAYLLAGLLTTAAWGQGYGTISGQVTDPAGAAIVGAHITTTDVGTGQARTAVSAQDGFYTLNSLRPSAYSLTVEAAGFKKYTQSGIVLQASQSLSLDLPLTIGSVSENVSVSAELIQVDTTSPTLKEVVDSARMVEIPLNGAQRCLIDNSGRRSGGIPFE